MEKDIPGRRDYVTGSETQRKERGMWKSETVKGVGVWISKGDWPTSPEK